MTDFKVGDKVEFLKFWEGKTGTVVVADDDMWPIRVKRDDGMYGRFYPQELKLVKPTTFKAGDEVTFVMPDFKPWQGGKGIVKGKSEYQYGKDSYDVEVTEVPPANGSVRVGHTTGFWPEWLELIKPQPKPKKGDWAKAVGYGHKGGSFEGRVGEVTGVHHTASDVLITLKYPFEAGKAAQGTFESRFIQAAEAPKPSFKVGDRVAPKQSAVSEHKGQTGTIEAVNPKSMWPFKVRFSDGQDEIFYEDEIEFAPKPVKQEFGTFLPDYAKLDAYLTSNLFSNGGAPAFAKGGTVSKSEAVEHPAHYGGDTTYEVIKVAEAWGLDKDAYLFNVLKYIARAGKKGSRLEDLKKGGFYLNRRIKQEEAK